MNVNLESLKRKILAYLDASEFAVFHGLPRGMETLPGAAWDVEHYPDFHVFLDVASKAGVKVVAFAAIEFDASAVANLEEQLEIADLESDEQRSFERRLREARSRLGQLCSVELAFDYNSRSYVYVARTEWYEDFLALEDEVMAHVYDDEDDDEDLGGFYSRN